MLRASVLALGLAAPLANPSTGMANPLITDTAIFVPANGITRYDIQPPRGSWRALANRRISGLTLSARHLLAGAPDGVHAFATDTGDPVWHRETETPVFAPVVHRQLAYVGTQGGALLALDPGTGRTVWKRRFNGWVYPPAMAGGTLIVGGSGPRLSGIDPDTGAIRWQRRMDQELVYRPVQTAPNRVVVTTFSGTVMALSGAGSPIWAIRDPAPSLSPAVADGRLLIAGLDGVLRSRDTRDGRLIWHRKITDRFIVTPTVTAKTVLVVHEKTLSILDIDTGRLIREHATPFASTSAPAVSGGQIVLFSPDGRPHLLDPGETPGVPLENNNP